MALALGLKVLGKKVTFRDPGDGTFYVCGPDWGTPTPGGQLDFAVRYTYEFSSGFVCGIPEYSKDWSQGGPLVERGWITITAPIQWRNDDVKWSASFHTGTDDAGNDDYEGEEVGPTPLIAAMRCFVASKLGEEVEIP